VAERSSSPVWKPALGSFRGYGPVLVAALALGAVALGTRLWAISDKSLWLDEAESWRYALMPLSRMIPYTVEQADQNPPFYFVMLHFWVKVFGDSEVGLRSLSAVAGALTVVIVAAAARRIQGTLLAATVAVLLLWNSTHLYHSQEARGYALMGLLALSASLALGAVIARPSIFRVALYTALLVGILYTHYSGFFVAAAHALVFAGYGTVALWRRRRPEILICGLVAFSLAALAYVPWLSNFLQTVRLGARGDVPPLSFDLVRSSFKDALGLARADDTWLVPTLVILGVGALGIARRWRDPVCVSLGALALVPLGQVFFSWQSKPVFDARQISPYVPALVFVLALGFVDVLGLIGRINLPVRLAGAAVIIALAGVLLSFMFKEFAATYTAPPLEDWRAAAADLHDYNGPIYIAPVYMLSPFIYYYGAAPNVQSFGLWSPESLPAGQTAMLGVSHQPAETALAALGPNINIESQRNYNGVTFFKLRLLYHGVLNVDISHVPDAQASWSVGALGYLTTTADTSYFDCQCDLDADRDGAVDDSFAVTVEFFDAGAGSISLFGFPPGSTAEPVVLANQPITNTGQWRTMVAEVPKGAHIGSRFALSRGVSVRRLQVMRTHLENVDVFGSYQAGTRWILRPDGYLQSADQYSYLDSSTALDSNGDGVVNQPFRIEFEYKGGASNPLQVFGLPPGQAFRPVPLDARPGQSDGEWHTIAIDVSKGAHLQSRVFIGKGVTLRAVRFEPLAVTSPGGVSQ
jgi:hypothetical protein